MSERTALYSDLRSLGADSFEAAIVLSIVEEMTVIELSRATAYLHEPRGKGGEWVGTPGAGLDRAGSSKTARRAKARLAKKQAVAARHPVMPQLGSPAAEDSVIKPDNTAHSRAFQQHLSESQAEHNRLQAQMEAKAAKLEADTSARLDAQAKRHVAMLTQSIKDNNAKLAEEENSEEKKKARQKAAIEGSVAVAGVIAAYAETKLGVPDLVAFATSAVGPGIQILSEWKKRL
jgi:hypothetical protein